MEFEAITTMTETDQMVKQVEKLILTGRLQVGQKLPSERELATQLQISRSVVNRGLQELMRLGFVDVRPRQGNFVTDYERNGNLETLNTILNFEGGRYLPALLKSIFQVRQLIENNVIALCPANGEVPGLTRCLAQIQLAETAVDKATRTFTFYHELAKMTPNAVYPMVLLHFRSIYITLGTWLVQSGGGSELEQRLQRLLLDLKSHQCRRAGEHNTALLAYWLDALLSRPEPVGG